MGSNRWAMRAKRFFRCGLLPSATKRTSTRKARRSLALWLRRWRREIPIWWFANAMLLNEFLKEHRKMQEQEANITQLKSTAAKQEATIAHQQKQIEALTVG